jgi:uncharacterized protein (TIGR02186 family)
MVMIASFLAALLASAGALAQQADSPLPENIQIGLSTNRVTITSDFSGADLTIFGAVDNADPQISRQGGYDVIVVLEGPAQPLVLWRRARILGVWVNAQSQSFVNVPLSYSVATTRAPQDITNPDSYKRLSLGTSYLYLEPRDRTADAATIAEFTAALREQKISLGLYSQNVGGVQFLSQTLFRATLNLPPNVPVGSHKARAFLFRNGEFIKETSSNLAIVKAGFEQTVYRTAHEQSLLYGFLAVALAMLTGWMGRLIFRKD